MDNSNVALFIGLMAGSIFFIDGWGPNEKNEKGENDFSKSRRFRGLSVLVAGGVITPILDYVSKNTKPEFFLSYLKGCIYGWFFVMMFGLLLYLFWIVTKQKRKESFWFKAGDFAYSILDFIYLGISDNPHLSAKRKSDVALAENIYKLESDYEYKKLEKELANADIKPNEIDQSTQKKIQQYEEQLKNIKTEADYTFNDWYYKGITEYDKGEYEKGIAYMKNGLEKDKTAVNAPDAYLYIGLCYDELGLFKKEIEQYDRIILLYPQYAYLYLAFYNKGAVLDSLNHYEEALAEYEKAIRLNPDYASAWYNKGLDLYHLERHEEAIKAYEETIKQDPEYAAAWNNKGVSLAKLVRYEEALKSYEEAIRIKPDYANPCYNLAVLSAYKNEKDKMLAYLKKAIDLDGSNKISAKTDEDFKAFWSDEDFKKLVES